MHKFKISTTLNITLVAVFMAAAAIIIALVNYNMRNQALVEAESKALILLDRNLATHEYFNQELKPKLFGLIIPLKSKDYFEPSWMSSTYVIRQIDKRFKSHNRSGYFYKDAAINARSPDNEADTDEKEFLEEMQNQKLEKKSAVRIIDGKPYFIVMRRGEVMENSCLRCHSNPQEAPRDLVQHYGPDRGFHRKTGEIISAISIRIPLSEAYANADRFTLRLSMILLTVLCLLFSVQFLLYKGLLLKPLAAIRGKARQIASHEGHLGEKIPQPFGRELTELTDAFNEMSVRLRYDRDHLEELVEQRTEELQETQKQIASSLKEKETLLKEIHHRVKNNLQVISSLLSLQSAHIKDPEALDIFRESMDRVRSMALIHNKLYQSENLAQINFAEYVKDLASGLLQTYNTRRDVITMETDIEPLILDIDTIIPLGLLINELVSNALKYAFPDERQGEIRIELKECNGGTSGRLHGKGPEPHGGEAVARGALEEQPALKAQTSKLLTLTIADNGIGFPEHTDYTNTESLGMQLVVILVDQLEGTIELDRSHGTQFRIVFREKR